jgi:hypothetical protein
VAAFVALGWLFAGQLEAVAARAASLGGGALALAAAVLAAYVVVKWVQRRRFLRELRIARITPEELARRLALGEDLVVVDLRHSSEFELDPRTIPGALHLPFEEVDRREGELPRDREIVLLCT